MEDMQKLACDAKVQRVDQQDDRTIIYLDQTVFYPQGGGQPYDTGTIESRNSKFAVEEVRFVDGEVLHIGQLTSGQLQPGDDVRCNVNEERRKLHARLHSGGHVIDMALYELDYAWEPTKGYHFPDGAYVEYQASIENKSKEDFIEKLNQRITDILSRNIKTELRFMPKEEMSKYCHSVPEYLPADKPSRIILYGDFGVPCGGTHVAALGDIGNLNVRKIKSRSGILRISYEVKP